MLGKGGVGILGGNVIGGLIFLSMMILSREVGDLKGGTWIGLGRGLRVVRLDTVDAIELLDAVEFIPSGTGAARRGESLHMVFSLIGEMG
jgi:hypothetical protein